MNSFIEAYRRDLAAQGISDDADDYTLTRTFLGPLAEQNPALFEQYPDFAKQYREIRLANAPGTLEGIKNTARTALDRSRQSMNAIGGVDAEDVASIERDIQARPSSVPWEDWQRSTGADARRAFLRDPIEITSNIIASGFAGSLPALGAGFTGGLAGGAMGGPVGGTIGAATGTFGGSLATEYGSKYLDVLRDSGADLTDADSIRRVLEDPEVRSRARGLAFRRGVPVAAFDAASAGLAGKFLKGVTGATTGQVMRQGAIEGAVQGALGGAGEVAGALSAGEKISPGAVFEEVIGEVGPAAVEVGGAGLRRSLFTPAATPTGTPAGTPAVVLPTPTPVQPTVGANVPTAPLVPQTRSNRDILAAVDALDDATALARRDELANKPARTPEEDTEFQLLLSRVGPVQPAAATVAPNLTPTAAPTPLAQPTVATEPPVVAPVTGIAVETPAVAAVSDPPAPAPSVVPKPESTYLYTIQRPQMEGDPGYLQIDEMVNGENTRSTTIEALAAEGRTIPQPPAWLPTGQFTLEQVTEAIAKGPPNATPLQSPNGLDVLQPSGNGPQVGQGNAVDQVAPAAGEVVEAETQEPVSEVTDPLPPKDAAPVVAEETAIPKPSEIPAVVPSTAPAPEERAAVVATETKAAPFAYGAIIEGGPSMDFRDFEPIAPQEWDRAIRANVTGKQAARGGKSGSRSDTRVAMALIDPDGKSVVLSGVVIPQRSNAVSLQRMAQDGKPLPLRDALAAGYKPLAIIHFTGEPTKISQRFASLAEFDAAYAASEKTSGTARTSETALPVTPQAVAEVRNAARTENEIQAEIDRLGGEFQRAETDAERDALSMRIIQQFDELNRVLSRGQSQTGDIAMQSSPARAPIEAQRTQEFIAVVERLRRQGANVELFTQEFFRLGVKAEIQAQIYALRSRFEQATTDSQRRAIAREINRRNLRMGEIDQARGATFSPWHISLAVDDLQNATTGNLVTLLHEAAEALTMRLNPAVKGRVAHAIQASLNSIRERTAQAAKTNAQPVANETGAFDALAENLAQRLTAEGVPDAPNLARAIWQWVKDLYYRSAMAIQRAFGAEPSDAMALDWFENQLRRIVSGDYDYRFASILDRYLPQPMQERARRYQGRDGTPGGIADYWNPYSRTQQQPSVLPNTSEATGWNVEFQTVGNQRTQNGEEIPGPEARARIDAAALTRFAEQLEEIRVASGTDLAWAEWWSTIGGTSGDDPKVMLAALAAQMPGVETAKIDGPRMTVVMNGLAGVEARRLVENLQAKAVNRAAASNEEIDTETDRVIAAAKDVNRLEGDRRNAELQEAALKDKLKALVRRFVKDNSTGIRLAEQSGSLAQAVRQAEGLLENDEIPEQYQRVFKAIMDGDVSVFDYVRAIARLDLPISDLTQRELVAAVRANADSNETLKALTQNRPLLTAVTTLVRENAGQVDEIALGWLRDAEQYAAIHGELETIRKATDDELRAMLANMEERTKTATLRDRIKRDYLVRRRNLQTARARVARAQTRVDTIESALPAIHTAVETAQQSGSRAPSEWVPTEGAQFTEMVLGEDGAWRSRQRTLVYDREGRLQDGPALEKAILANNLWLKANEAKKGSATYERALRQTTQLQMVDASGQYQNAQTLKLATFITPLVAEARRLGATGAQVAQMLQFFEHIRFVNHDTVEKNAAVWSRAFRDVQRSAGLPDNGQMVDAIYDPVSYFLNTEPGLDEEAALRGAVRVARARLTKAPGEGFNAALERLLRASKTGFETLIKVATDNGAFVNDTRLKSGLRDAVARGWLTSMRSMDAGVVGRVLKDMQQAGWKLEYETETNSRGLPQTKVVRAATFRDLDAESVSNPDALRPVLQKLFTPGIVRDWLVPFINKGGVEVFKHEGQAIPQLTLQNAWEHAGNDVLTWIDAVGQQVGLPVPDEDNPNPVAEFRLSMLRQLDGLFDLESKIAADVSQTRNMFDPMGPKPHVMMDARVNDMLPPEHLRFALLDRHTSQMLLSEIAFHAAFGRNGQRMTRTLQDLTQKADAAKTEYAGLVGTTKNARVAEAVARGWDYKDLENTAKLADQVRQFQTKLETFMSVGNKGGPFDDVRAWMTFLNFMSGQIVDNPKTAFYNVLSLAQTPFAQRSLGPATLRTVSDAFVSTAKSGFGSLLDAMHLNLLNASGYAADVASAQSQARNLPWSQAVADIGAGGRQTTLDKVLVRPLQFLRYVQNKGVAFPGQGQGTNPRLALLPGGGVANFVAKTAAVGGMAAQARQLERIVANGIKYFSTNRDAAQDGTFRFKARDLGLGRWDQGVFDWWRAKAPEFQLGQLEDLVRAAMPLAAKGERLLTRDQVLRVAHMVSTEVNGDSSINTLPSLLVTNPFLRGVFPLLRWPFWAMHATHEGLRSVNGKRDYAQFARGLATLAMWNLPLGLAFTFLLDRYDEDLLGKKSNLPPLGAMAGVPIIGPAAEAMMADRSIPDTLKAYFVRSARAGNIYGVGSDLAGQLASPTDSQSGRRVFSLDQRILVMSQLLNLQQAVSNAVHQDGFATWASVWSPMFRSIGGNGALHVLDVANNALGLDNAESRQVARTNANNWLRASASELDIELRAGGSGTPTPMSVWTRSMSDAAMANDRIGFLDAYRKALEVARKNVASDPTVPVMDREREAEARVRAGWRGRDPLNIFARHPSEIEVRRMIGLMDESGQQSVRDALNRYQQFSRLIAVSPQMQQQRALEKRLVSPPRISNPFRAQSAFAPTY